MTATYADSLEAGNVLIGDRVVKKVEVGDRWVWVTFENGDRETYPRWKVLYRTS